MTFRPVFALVPIERLRGHEEIDGRDLPALAAEIRRLGELRHPIWVARCSFVILHGHHRFASLKRRGALRAPAWLIDYHDPAGRVDRRYPRPPKTQQEVEAHAAEGLLFPPKTTKHQLPIDPGERTTPLAELLRPDEPWEGHSRWSAPSGRRPGAGGASSG